MQWTAALRVSTLASAVNVAHSRSSARETTVTTATCVVGERSEARTPDARLGRPRSSPHDSRALDATATTTCTLVVLCQVVQGLTFTAIPLLLPLIRIDLEISFTQAGILTAAATLSYALGQFPAGYLADRLGPRRLIAIGLLGWSAFSLALGVVHDFRFAVASQFIAGAFRALLFAPGLALLTAWFPRERRATAISLYMLGGFAGNVILALGGPWLASLYGWRTALVALALPGIAIAAVFHHYAKDKPRASGARAPRFADALKVGRHPIMWICAALQFVRFTAVTAFYVWVPSLLVAERGMSIGAAGAVVAASSACAAVSNTVGGYVCDRLRNPPLVIGVSLAVLAVTAALLGSVESVPGLLLVIAVNAVFIQFYFGALFLVPVEVLGERYAGSATGFANLFANLGGLLTAYLLGVVKDRTESFAWGFFAVSAACGTGVVLAYMLFRMRRRVLDVRQAQVLRASLATDLDQVPSAGAR